MKGAQGRDKPPPVPYVRYKAPYSTIPPALVRVLVERKVGRNGWPVMVALCSGVHADGTMDRKSADRICDMTGLSHAQVARGMSELRDKGIIKSVEVRGCSGRLRPDRSSFGRVARYRIEDEVLNQAKLHDFNEGLQKTPVCHRGSSCIAHSAPHES